MQGWLCGVTSAGNHYQYIYDAEGRLVTTASRPDANCALGTTTLADYVVDQFGRQITEADGSANWRHTNVYADGELLATYDGAGLHYALNDWLGDKRVQALASSTGTTVEETCWNLPFNDGFGCSGTGADATEQHYTGKEHDKYASQLDHLGARSYTGYSARFLSPDPSGLAFANPNFPQSLNLYAYGLNNPLKYTDPSGLDCANGQGMDLGQGGGDLDPCEGYDGSSNSSDPNVQNNCANGCTDQNGLQFNPNSNDSQINGGQDSVNANVDQWDDPAGYTPQENGRGGWYLPGAVNTTGLEEYGFGAGEESSSPALAGGVYSNILHNAASCIGQTLSNNGASLALDAASALVPGEGIAAIAAQAGIGAMSAVASAVTGDTIGALTSIGSTQLSVLGPAAEGAGWRAAGSIVGFGKIVNIGSIGRDLVSTISSYQSCIAGN
jgi:RHS repeat-associated protein